MVSGQLPRRVDSDRKYPIVWKDEQGRGGVRYQYRVKAIIKDGYVTTNPGLAISNASEVILLISAATSYNGYDKCPDTEGKDEAAIALGHLADASVRGYEEMKAEHIADYRHFFDRVAFDLSYDGSKNSIPTDRRLAEYSKGAAEFCEDWLVEKDGWLITAPSTSPENVFIDEHGKKGVVTIGSAIDLEIIWDLFNNLVEVGPASRQTDQSDQDSRTGSSLQTDLRDQRRRRHRLEQGMENQLLGKASGRPEGLHALSRPPQLFDPAKSLRYASAIPD